MRRVVVASGFCAALMAVGCGSSSSSKDTTPSAAATKKAADAPSVKITAPTAGQTVRAATTQVRGIVTPPTATVQVAGKPATVHDGLFEANVPLNMGANTIDVIAVAGSAAPVNTSVAVTRGRSESAIAHAAAVRRAKKRAAAAAAAKRKVVAQARANQPVAVPSEVGVRLDVAEDDLKEHALRYEEIGGGTFGIVVTSNWTVCETKPAAGAQVKKHTRVKLIVDRSC